MFFLKTNHSRKAAAIILLFSLSACANNPKKEDSPLANAKTSSKTKATAKEPVKTERTADNDLRKSPKFSTLSQNIHFNQGSSELSPSSRRALNEIAIEIKRSGGSFEKILIEGLTDNQGEAQRTHRLSDARAQNVRNYLIRQGVAPTRLEAIGRGAVARDVTGTSSQQARDRRVDFQIVE